MNRTLEIFGIQPCLKDWNLINVPSEIRAYPREKSQKLINVPGMFIPDSRVCACSDCSNWFALQIFVFWKGEILEKHLLETEVWYDMYFNIKLCIIRNIDLSFRHFYRTDILTNWYCCQSIDTIFKNPLFSKS